VTLTFRANNKVGFVDDSLLEPTSKEDDLSKLQAWKMANSKISLWILNVIDARIRKSVAYANVATTKWDKLKKHCVIANVPKIHQLKAGMKNYKQGGLSVVEFYSRITDLWVELENHNKIPICSCIGCKYGVANEIVQKYE